MFAVKTGSQILLISSGFRPLSVHSRKVRRLTGRATTSALSHGPQLVERDIFRLSFIKDDIKRDNVRGEEKEEEEKD